MTSLYCKKRKIYTFVTVNRREILIERIKKYRESEFDELALEVFDYQLEHNSVYRSFCETLKGEGFCPKNIEEIPFLPVSFFKTHKVVTGNFNEKAIYRSSATTGSIQSKHFVYDTQLYFDNAKRTFEHFYGKLEDWLILALLPGYIERGDSSLIAMAHYFINNSDYKESGFFLDEFEDMVKLIHRCGKGKVLLLGVSFALQSLAELNPNLKDVVVMETGGMKGRGKEMPKKAFHENLKKAFSVPRIHSEYGMTELLSQAYSKGEGVFEPAPTMKVLIKEITDPFRTMPAGKSGIINLIDLINIDSCSFVETQDLGFVYPNGNFELLGRVDAAEIRGCNLLVSEI